jgi:2-deoxystreptamine N-acetyl-D-glucosaminyltransferase/2-deoxystreptamine glucosyltransferase
MVGRTAYRLPLSPPLATKFDALERELDLCVLALDDGGGRDARFRLVRRVPLGRLEGAAFYALLPARVARALRQVRPDAVLVQGAQETALVLAGRALARSRAKVILDLHGDWRADTRLYGSPARRLFGPLGDAVARLAVRRADAVRTISAFTTGLVRAQGVEPTATFPAFMELEPFLTTPPAGLPDRPVALFVGVLERYKGVDVLSEAWRHAAARIPDAELHLVGRGTLAGVVERLRADLPAQVRWTPRLATAEVASALDRASLLVLPSRSEGMGRILVEAFCRGRGAVASDVGGIPDLVEDGLSGVLVPPGDARRLGDALVHVLSDPALAARLGAGARAAAPAWTATPEEYAARVRELVERTVASRA